MQFITLGNHNEVAAPHGFTLPCPITGRMLYEQGEFLVHDNNDYHIPLPLLSKSVLKLAFKNSRQWRAWENEGRLKLTQEIGHTLTAKDHIRALAIRPSKYGSIHQSSTDSTAVTIDFSEVLADPVSFAQNHQKLSISTDHFTPQEKEILLRVAEKTAAKSKASERSLPTIGRTHLSGSVMDIRASKGYLNPEYHGNTDGDEIFFNYHSSVTEDSTEQVEAYLSTLPNHYLTYIIHRPSFSLSADPINYHIFDLRDLEHLQS